MTRMSAPTSSKPTSPVNAVTGLDSRTVSGNSPDAAAQGEMIDSLGAALAGVNIGGGGGNKSSSNGGLFHGSNDSASPFSMNTGPTPNESELGWASTFSGSAAAPPAADLVVHQEAQVKDSLDLFCRKVPRRRLETTSSN